MPTAQHLRAQIEARIPSALSPLPRVSYPIVPTGIREIDSLLHGGLPVGAISEIVGPECSGRTSPSAHICSRYDPSRQGVRMGRRFRHLAPGICGGHWSGSFAVALDTLRPALHCCALAAHGRKATQAKTGIAPGGWQSSADGSQRSFRGSQRSAGCSSSVRGSTAQAAA